MAEYLKQEQDLKNGYHVKDILTNICFVGGSQDVYQMFENTIEDLLAEEQSNLMEEVIKKITDDMRKYNTKLSIFSIIKIIAKVESCMLKTYPKLRNCEYSIFSITKKEL